MRKTALEGSMKNVADGLREEGRWQEAEEMHRKALDGCLPAETGRSDWHFRVAHLKDPSFQQKRVEEAAIIEKSIISSEVHMAADHHLRRKSHGGGAGQCC